MNINKEAARFAEILPGLYQETEGRWRMKDFEVI